MDTQKDIYANISEIRDGVDALLKRGKPASVADLQELMAKVEAKSRPTYHLPAEEVAAQLVPELLPLLPTPATLAQAGQQAAARMEAAIKAGTAVSVQQVLGVMQQLVASVQESTRQTTAAVAEQRAAAASYPRSIPVDFLQGWRWPMGLVGSTVFVVLLLSWAGGAFRGVSQVKYDQLLRTSSAIGDERDFYRAQIGAYRANMAITKEGRQLAGKYFPAYQAPAAGE
jgi:hypothetical protein